MAGGAQRTSSNATRISSLSRSKHHGLKALVLLQKDRGHLQHGFEQAMPLLQERLVYPPAENLLLISCNSFNPFRPFRPALPSWHRSKCPHPPATSVR